jgi:hypothetical protein
MNDMPIPSLDDVEAHLRAIINNPGPLLDDNGIDVVRDRDGKPILNDALRAEATKLLTRIQRERGTT